MKNCEYFQMLLSNFHDDKQTLEINLELSGHIQNCEECQKFNQAMKNQASLLKSLPEIPHQLKLPQEAQVEQAIPAKWYHNKFSLTLAQAAAVIIFLSAWSVINVYQSISNDSNQEELPFNIVIEQVETIQTINFSPQPAMLVSSSSAGDNNNNEEESL